ncbi:MAG: anti-sigma factor family protein [Steroidobacteraceae bacterium]
MRFSDEMLMAYADGELDLVARAEIEAAMADDPAIAHAVERHRAFAARLRSAYSGVLEEPVPERLADLVKGPVAAPVVDLASMRAERAQAHALMGRWQLPRWSALAASVAVGLFVGMLLMRGPSAPYEESAVGLVAREELDVALTSQLASAASDSHVRVGISFRDRGGAYCRTFHLQREAPLAGLACRSGDEWKLQVLAAAPAREGELRPAAAMPMAVLHAVDAAIEGDPLDAAAEAAARDAGWRTIPGVAE